jgi:hypothetical protein
LIGVVSVLVPDEDGESASEEGTKKDTENKDEQVENPEKVPGTD